MSWTRIDHPSQAVKVGERIDVMVLRYDREQNRISLGLKQILPDPWEEVPKHYKVGDVVAGTVTRVVPFGAFIRLESGIEGIIPNAELPGERGKRATDVLSAGQKVDAKIVNIRSGERRMTLSLRQFEQAKERQQLKDYMDRQEGESRVTIGDLFGSMLAGAQTAGGEAPSGEAAEAGSEWPVDEMAGEEPVAEEVTAEDSSEVENAAWSSSESPAESEAEKG
jgi:4-hydroxy-3-methylbut-2-enyl diphosphate reductase